MIRVLHINLHDKKYGLGCEAHLLHEALPAAGIQSELWVSERFGKNEQRSISQFASYSKQPHTDFEQFTNEDVMQIFKNCDLTQVDVIHIHMTGKYFSPLILPFFQVKPVVLSVYDSSVYTAGCYHSAHCSKWQTESCNNCPMHQNNSEQQIDKHKAFILKENLYKTQNLQIVCANSWQKGQLTKSILKDKNLTILPQLYDQHAFYPDDQRTARVNLGLLEYSFIVFLHGDILGDFSKQFKEMTAYAVRKIRERYQHVTVVYYGEGAFLVENADMVRNLSLGESASLMGEYYRAADLNLYFSGFDQVYSAVIEAAACALPSVIFDVGAAKQIVDETTGFVIPAFDQNSLVRCFEKCLTEETLCTQLGSNALARFKQAGGFKDRLTQYVKLYTGLSGKRPMNEVIPIAAFDNMSVQGLLERGWEAMDKVIADKVKAMPTEKEKNVYIDSLFKEVFTTVDITIDKTAIWEAVKLWMKYREIAPKVRCIDGEDRRAHLLLLDCLRTRLTEYLRSTNLEEFLALDLTINNSIIVLWRMIFLNVNSVLHRDSREYVCPEKLLMEERQTGYPYFLIKSMYLPYIDKVYSIDILAAIKANLPVAHKIILMLWLTSAPLYSGNEFHRQQVLKYIELISKNMRKELEILSPSLCILFIEHFVMAFWRISYLGGNNIQALREYGHFIRENVAYRFPKYCKKIKPRSHKPGEKLRIGYISMNFRNQAVSQYMANRLIYHDKDKFFVKTFILLRNADEMTEQIKNCSDEWEEFKDLMDFPAIAESIKKSKLDLLIFADIGMDVVTYTLASMNLAPKQAVLVGHGTTTGLSTLDFYISGDHEPQDADSHYTEQLVRLPVLGSAQLPPKRNQSNLTRAKIGVPDDAVMFISCANGIKHYHTRDELLIEILQKADNAYIVLKPFQSPDTVDHKFMDRLKRKAEIGGVADRLILLPPLPNPGDLMGLITLADVQLDTYPYGGWTTNLEALYYYLPIVTQEGDMARSRWGAGLLRALGISEGIAYNEQQYVDWAVRFAKDNVLRSRIAGIIKDKAADILFNGEKAQSSYDTALLKILEDK